MAHGKPDWGLVGPKTTVYGQDDIGELAVRLNSPVMWDRRGDVILMDSMEDGGGLRAAGTVGAGDYYTTRAAMGRHGPLCHYCYLAGGAMSQGYVSWTLLPTGALQLGFEISFGFDPNIASLQFTLSWYDGVDEHEATVQYLPATQVLQYRTGAVAYALITNAVALMYIYQPYHVIKLVADFDTDEWVRVIVNENTYNLAGVGVYVAGNVAGPMIQGMMTVVSDLVGVSQFSADRAILTQNEPL